MRRIIFLGIPRAMVGLYSSFVTPLRYGALNRNNANIWFDPFYIWMHKQTPVQPTPKKRYDATSAKAIEDK